MRRAAYIASIAMVTAGLVMLVDVGLTLVWTEPISALYAKYKQSHAEGDLRRLTDEFSRSAPKRPPGELSPSRSRRLAARFAARVSEGDAIGKIKIDRIGLSSVLVEGTGTADLQVGPGHYAQTALPGAGKTVGVAGHRTTYGAPFHDINDLRRGDEIALEMPYGRFTYRVNKHSIVEPSDTSVLRNRRGERLVLTSCHPLYSAAKRYVVTARLESSRR